MLDPQETSQAWKQLSRASWQRRNVPGMVVIALVILARLVGIFQEVEWKTLDGLLRLRPAETVDDRLLVVGVTEADIQKLGTYPIRDRDLAALINRLAQDKPRVIGVDIFRDFPVEPGHLELKQTFQTVPIVVGIEKISGEPVPPPASLPPERVGFNDFPLDADGFVRRAFLGAFPPVGHPQADRFHLAFPLVLAQQYLAREGLTLTNGQRNPKNMRFGDRELEAFQGHSGGYVQADEDGVQMLINVRSGRVPFEHVSMEDVVKGRVAAEQIRDRVILIGIMSLSNKDLVNSGAVNTENPGLFYGVEMHAHITSQILSTVLDDRPGIRVWTDPWEYLWILLWGLLGMALVRLVPRPAWHMLLVGCVALVLVGMSTAALWMGGWWLPLIPTLLAFTLNGLVLPAFDLYDQTLRSRIAERQRVIEETYDAIHNGPLQTLALLLKQRETLDPNISTQLINLNTELRAVYNRLQQESLPQEEQLQLGSQHIVDLRNPLHEVLYEVYLETVGREFPGFASLRFKVVNFEPLVETGLTVDDRRSLCRWLEEMVCNVGKHAIGAKRLTVICQATDTHNLIRVEDNGQSAPEKPGAAPPSSDTASQGRGTQQAHDLAQRLGGSFTRTFNHPGTRCELTWPLHPRRSKWLRLFPKGHRPRGR